MKFLRIKERNMFAFDFFCGAGGLTYGLADAGISVIAGFDIDKECQETYEHNNPASKFVVSDIREIEIEDLCHYSKGIPFEEMLFAGCAPCQPFSKQRRGPGSGEDSTLLSHFGKLVEAALPGQILVENVPGIARVKGNSTFRRFLRILERNGYQYIYDFLDAKRFGVPQSRRRLILIGARGYLPTLPASRFGPGLLPYRTVRQAISHFPVIYAGESHPALPNHVAAALSPLNLTRVKQTPSDGGDRRDWPRKLHLRCHMQDHYGHTDVYGRMRWDAPSPTLTSRCNSLSNGRYGHPVQDRAISLREAAAIQSFPDRYVFFGIDTHVAAQIGNAVPVLLAKRLGTHILRERYPNLDSPGKKSEYKRKLERLRSRA